MGNSWDDMRRAKEDSYFAKKEQEALERLAARKDESRKLPSPVTGEPMELITVLGVNLDRCPTTGGIWLDPGELEQLLQIAHDQGVQEAGGGEKTQSWLLSFFRTISSPAKKAT